MIKTPCYLLVYCLCFLSELSAAEGTYVLRHSLFSPSTAAQRYAAQGSSVAIDETLAVAGEPAAVIGKDSAGVVKVYDATNGGLLHVLRNPRPEARASFGDSVAVSGKRIVVGAAYDNRGETKAFVYDLTSATPTVPVITFTNPPVGAFDRFGHAVAISGTRIVVGTLLGPFVTNRTGSVYVYDLASTTPTLAIATLENPSATTGDHFGASVSISGTRIIVGASGDNTGAADAGSAYVYDLATATPTVPIARLNNPTPVASDFFGTSVSISGIRIAVGANGDDTGAGNTGSAYVYDLSSATPTVPIATLNNPTPAVNDYFGTSISISGTRIVVGTSGKNTGAADAGSAYVYDLSSATPTVPIATLNNPTPEVSDYFGSAVAASGRLVIVGAYGDDTRATDAGSAYIYDLTSAMPTIPIATLNDPSPAPNDEFGNSVAISGTRVVVGAYWDNMGAIDSGTASVFDLSSPTPSIPLITLTNPTPAISGNFGISVALSGARVVVGSRSSGAYLYDLASVAPNTPVVTLTNPTAFVNDRFGSSVALSGMRIVVGADGNNTGAPAAGGAYVYDIDSAMPNVPVATLNNPSPGIDDYFGASVAISGPRVVIGAPRDDTGAVDAGAAYVYDLAGTSPTVPVAALNDPHPAASDYFGTAVSVSGARVVIGNPQKGANDAGSAYVYDLISSTPTVPIATLNNPNPAISDYFGASVSISGMRIAVGAYLDDAGATNSGSAYIYDLASATPTVPIAFLVNPTPGVFDRFGSSVVVDGSTVVVGTPGDATVVPDKGAAYIFGCPPQLDIYRSDGSAAVRWPTWATDFVLDETGVLNRPFQGVWSQAALPYQTNAGYFFITINSSDGNRFYRLRQRQ